MTQNEFSLIRTEDYIVIDKELFEAASDSDSGKVFLRKHEVDGFGNAVPTEKIIICPYAVLKNSEFYPSCGQGGLKFRANERSK